MSMFAHFTKAMASGFFLVIGCSALISSGNTYVGAALFTVALCAICSLETPLYTGAVGYARTGADFAKLAVALLGNMAGCAVLGLLVSVASPEMSADAAALVLRKVYPPHTAFILSFVCGILMFTAVHIFRTRKSYVGILTCVPAFIICSFEHSIAYMGYMGLGRIATLPVLLSMLIFVIGNGAGALVINLIVQFGRKKD